MTLPAAAGLTAALATPEWASRLVTSLEAAVLPATAALAVLGLLGAVAAVLANRAALANRVSMTMVPTETFDPSLEELRRWGAAIAATRRRRDALTRRAGAVRFALSARPGERAVVTVTCPAHAVGILRAACPAEVELLAVGKSSQGEDFPEGKRRRRGIERATPRYNRPETVRAVDQPQYRHSETRIQQSPPSWVSRMMAPLRAQAGHRERSARSLARAERLVAGGCERVRGPIPVGVPSTPVRDSAGEDFSTTSRLFRRGHPYKAVTARSELVLSSPRHRLGALELVPDPLSPLVGVLGDLALGEAAEVCVDVLALSAGRRRRDLRAALADDRAKGRRDWASALAGLGGDPLGGKAAAPAVLRPVAAVLSPLERLEDRTVVKGRHARLSPGEPGFAVQVLVVASGPRARSLVGALVAGFAPAGDRAAWRRTGHHLGPWHWGGADARGRRAGFDWRVRSGWFGPRQSNVVGVSEIAGWIKPPSRHCAAGNPLRSGGLVPGPPSGMATWEPGAIGLWPLGTIVERGVERVVGVPMAETLFTLACGNAGGGKTAPALVRMAALASMPGAGTGAAARPGLLYIDPHSDGMEALRGYLVPHADRVIEFDLSREDSASQGAWNPLDMTGATAAGIGRRVSLFTAAYSTLVMSRGLTLLTKTITALCELGLQLPPHLQPTIFQIPTLLTDETWRRAVVPFLSAGEAPFWADGGRLARQSGGMEATGPVTNPIDRLRSSRSAAALFGQSRSSFDMRRAMDDGSIVLVCPGLGEDKDTLVMGLFLFELHLAARSRRDLAVEDRRPFHAWVDEMQIADRAEGSAVIAQMVQEDRKFGLRLNGLVQQPTSLQRETLSAVLTNRSHLMTSAVGHESAAVLAKEMGGKVEPGVLTHLARYHHLASVTVGGQRSLPFRLGGLYLGDVFGPPASAEELAAMEAVVDRSMRRRPVNDVLGELATLDGRILDALRQRVGPSPSGTLPPSRGRRFAVVPEQGRGWTAG